jgi:hypothetical protein
MHGHRTARCLVAVAIVVFAVGSWLGAQSGPSGAGRAAGSGTDVTLDRAHLAGSLALPALAGSRAPEPRALPISVLPGLVGAGLLLAALALALGSISCAAPQLVLRDCLSRRGPPLS